MAEQFEVFLSYALPLSSPCVGEVVTNDCLTVAGLGTRRTRYDKHDPSRSANLEFFLCVASGH